MSGPIAPVFTHDPEDELHDLQGRWFTLAADARDAEKRGDRNVASALRLELRGLESDIQTLRRIVRSGRYETL